MCTPALHTKTVYQAFSRAEVFVPPGMQLESNITLHLVLTRFWSHNEPFANNSMTLQEMHQKRLWAFMWNAVDFGHTLCAQIPWCMDRKLVNVVPESPAMPTGLNPCPPPPLYYLLGLGKGTVGVGGGRGECVNNQYSIP